MRTSSLPTNPSAVGQKSLSGTCDVRSAVPLAIENQNPLTALTWEAIASEPWLRLSATSGTTPAEITVSIDPTGVPSGRYGGTITVNSNAGNQVVTIDASFVPACVGDCDGNGTVAVNELILGVNIALGNAPAAQCAAFDPDATTTVSISELVQAVNAALNGC